LDERGKEYPVSVVIISKNSARTIGECLESLARQDVMPHEVIVVDGGSRDGTLDEVERIRNKIKCNLRVIKDSNGNRATSRNLGLYASTGSVLAFLDADCIAPHEWVRVIRERINSSTEDKMAVGGPYVPTTGATSFAKATYHLLGVTTRWATAQFMRREDPSRYVRNLLGGNVGLAKQSLISVKGFDKRLDWCEDVDFSRRISASGLKLAFVPELYVYHYWPGWRGLLSLARVAYQYGKGRVVASRVNPALRPVMAVGFLGLLFASLVTVLVFSFYTGIFWQVTALVILLYLISTGLVMAKHRASNLKAALSPIAFLVSYTAGLVREYSAWAASKLRKSSN
jgi:glycosyltransferase involved in cell wall biosynthesis